eukprot:PhF_6_TR11270/c0_g1_i1/m.18192
MALLPRVITAMESFAPLSFADTTWDNVGLLLDSVNPEPTRTSVGLALDISPAVITECVAKNVGVLVAYHPAIFPNLKKLVKADPKQRALLTAARHGIAIYCPHTALDNCPGGINAWIASGVVGEGAQTSFIDEKLSQGCKAVLEAPLPLGEVINRMKSHFRVPAVRVALGKDHTIQTLCKSFGICAGSGGSVLRPCSGKCDVVITGEMGHHEVLSMSQKGTTVLLVEHGSSERGYLSASLQPRLAEALGKDTPVFCIESDRDVIEYL